MLNDKTLALLGDRAAQDRITERWELLPCPSCGKTPRIENSGVRQDFSGSNFFHIKWMVVCECGNSSDGKNTQYFVDNCGEFSIFGGIDGKKEAIEEWNRRAPILTQEQIEALVQLEEDNHDT